LNLAPSDGRTTTAPTAPGSNAEPTLTRQRSPKFPPDTPKPLYERTTRRPVKPTSKSTNSSNRFPFAVFTGSPTNIGPRCDFPANSSFDRTTCLVNGVIVTDP
jgi:hypothetical protein